AIFGLLQYPLVSKCGYIARLELQPSISSYSYEVKLETFPGGSETFEAILRFCYGLPLDLNPQNIAPLRCASEYLEMSEDLEDGNLITKTEAFLTFVILSSWKDTITVLKTCEALSPWAENLQIVRRCCDSITWKASRENFSAGGDDAGDAWWLDDVATLHISHFTRIVTAVRAKGTKPELVGKCIMQYASKWLTGMDEESKDQRGHGQGKDKEEQTTIIENLISLLPPQQEAVPTHPSLLEHDRKRVCRLMNCEKLSLDACIHAAQNDRLPVRTVIQVLFSEQVKLRAAMQRKDPAESGNISEQEVHQTETKSEIMTLKAELENVKTRMAELQKDYLELQQEYAKLNNKHKHTLAWGWKRIRTSSLFHRKVAVDGVETVEGRQRSHSTSQAPKLRRRVSV
ncbi:BTB/POZ domain-containing protein DOT3, partial [Linum perenne]